MKSRLQSNTPKLLLAILSSILFTVLVFLMMWGFGKWDPTKIDTTYDTGMAQKIVCCAGVSVLLGALMFVISREYVRDDRAPREERPVWFYPILSGFLSLAAMCVAYSFLGMWPFGEKSAMMVDMHHQYAPLLAELRYDILNGGNPLYTFEVGLGANYLSLFGYYLASPFNLFLLVFPERLLAQGILTITLLKNAISGALFALCVQQLYRKRGLHIPIVSVMYSMMMYLLAYSWNLMWLDVIMILPLIVLGFERLMKTGKFLTYVLSLAYALYANYYIGFMVCIFLVLYYLAYCLRTRRESKPLFVSFVRFAGFSVLAAGLVAALLIPVYFALQNTSAAGSTLPTINNTLDIFQLLGRHLADTSPTIRAGNLPNIYCGVLTAICVPLFALNKGIRPRRRAAYMACWLVLFFSFLVNWTDLAWHGLHSPNDLPYRFSFVYSFFLLLMACETLLHLKHIELRQVFCVFAGAVAYIMLEERFGDEAYDFSTVYINLAILAIYTIILACTARKLMRRRVAMAVLLLAVTAEMALGGGGTFVQLNRNEYFTRHADYLDNDVTTAIRTAVQEAQKIGDETYGEDFYRLEFLPRRTCVDTALFHYRGLTSFSSSNYYDTTLLLGGWGYAINGVNSHLYKTYQPFTDSLLGIRYIAYGADVVAPSSLVKLADITVGKELLSLYENPYALGLGYVVDADIKNYHYTDYDPIYSQNDLFQRITDTYVPLFTLCNVDTLNDDTGILTDSQSAFHVYPDGFSNVASFTATVNETAPVFIFADCRAADELVVEINGQSQNITPYEPYIINAGELQAGTQVNLTVVSDVQCIGNFYVAKLNTDVFGVGMEEIGASSLKVTEMKDYRITGTVSAAKDGVLMTSIPYDSSWSVTVDGKAVDTFAVADGFLGIDVTAGEHTVTFTYIPKGLLVGAAISATSLLVLIILLIVFRLRQKPAKAEPLNYENAQPIQNGFSITDEPLGDLPPLPETLQELTESVEPTDTDPPTT